MEQIFLTALTFAILNVATVPAHAAIYYVNGATGNDNNSGSTTAPWKSISKAANTLAAGDTVIILAGVYRETVTPMNSGTAANPITYQAEPGAEVIISGTDPLTSSWSQHSGNIYKTNVQLPLGDGAQLFVNGNMMMEASWPNNPSTDSDTKWLVERKLSTATEGTQISPTRFSIVGGDIGFDVPVGSKLFISTMLGHGWSNYTCEVMEYDPGSKQITFDVPFVLEPAWSQNMVSHNKGTNARKSLFFLHGNLSYLDMEKEYFHDSAAGTLYLYQPGGGIPRANSVEYKIRNTGIDLNGRKFITVEGIDLFACNLISDKTSENIIVDRLNAKYLSHWTTSHVPDDVVGIKLFGSNNEIKNSDISYSIGHGIHVSGDNTKILNNRVTDCSYLGLYRNNIWVDGLQHVVSYNTALRSGRSILGGKFVNTKVTNNEFAYANYLSADGACVYLGFWDFGNSELAYNYVHHSGRTDLYTKGIYFDNFNCNVVIHHNHTEGMQINGPRSGVSVINNTIFGRELNGFVANENPHVGEGSGFYLANNIIFRNTLDKYGDGGTNTKPKTMLMNWEVYGNGAAGFAENGDLASDSPCRNLAGALKIPYINDNVTDGKPDLGAFEYGVPRWEYGCYLSRSRNMPFAEINFPMMNQIQNSGFEKADAIPNWTNNSSNVTASPGKEKGRKAAVTKANTNISQGLTGLKPNSKYQLTAWIKAPLGSIPVLVIKDYGGIEKSVRGESNPDNWLLNEVDFTTGLSNEGATVYLRNDGSGSIQWDQVGIFIQLQDVAIPVEPARLKITQP